jgi:hypothetical protein
VGYLAAGFTNKADCRMAAAAVKQRSTFDPDPKVETAVTRNGNSSWPYLACTEKRRPARCLLACLSARDPSRALGVTKPSHRYSAPHSPVPRLGTAVSRVLRGDTIDTRGDGAFRRHAYSDGASRRPLEGDSRAMLAILGRPKSRGQGNFPKLARFLFGNSGAQLLPCSRFSGQGFDCL